MANLNQPDVRVQVLINKDTAQGQFQDAVYFSKEEFDALDESALTALKEKRASDWVASVESASRVEYTPTEEELMAQKLALQEEIAQVDGKLLVMTNAKQEETVELIK